MKSIHGENKQRYAWRMYKKQHFRHKRSRLRRTPTKMKWWPEAGGRPNKNCNTPGGCNINCNIQWECNINCSIQWDYSLQYCNILQYIAIAIYCSLANVKLSPSVRWKHGSYLHDKNVCCWFWICLTWAVDIHKRACGVPLWVATKNEAVTVEVSTEGKKKPIFWFSHRNNSQLPMLPRWARGDPPVLQVDGR